MNIKTFLLAASLILLAGVVLYFVIPKYTFEHKGGNMIRKNKYTGQVEYKDEKGWVSW